MATWNSQINNNVLTVTQLSPTLCDPMNCIPPGSSICGIFQARILEWVYILTINTVLKLGSIFKMDYQQGPTVWQRECCSVSCGSLDRSRVWGRTDTRICMAGSLCCPLETITTLLIGYTPMQNKKE